MSGADVRNVCQTSQLSADGTPESPLVNEEGVRGEGSDACHAEGVAADEDGPAVAEMLLTDGA